MKLPFPLRSLRAQVALAFGLLVVALAVSLSIALAALLRSLVEREEGQRLSMVARHVAEVLADGLHQRNREIQVLSQAEDVWGQGLDSAASRRLLARAQATQPDNTWIGVADTAGTVQSATGGLMVGRNARERPWFTPGLQGPFVGDVHLAKMLSAVLPPEPDGEPLRFVDFAAPVRVDGKTVGVLVAHGTWRWAHEVIERLRPADAAALQLESFIFDRSGQMIYAPARSLQAHLGRKQTLPPVSVSGVVAWADGRHYLTARAPVAPRSAVSDLGWTVVSREPVEIAFAGAQRSALQALAIGLAFAVAAGGLAGWLSDRVTRPLRQIARSARAVERGDAGAHIPAFDSSTELQDLAGALSTMTHKLLQANSDLESRVGLRTAELERVNRELAELARHDPLTGLLNRRGFNEHLAAALASAARRSTPLSLILVDADHFKRVNDQHGHEAGDRALVAIAQALKQRLRESDVVARLGGEEFVALLPDTPVGGARALADGLVAMVADTLQPQVGRLTISCGVSAVEATDSDGRLALRQADEALYRAKQGGRNRAESWEAAA